MSIGGLSPLFLPSLLILLLLNLKNEGNYFPPKRRWTKAVTSQTKILLSLLTTSSVTEVSSKDEGKVEVVSVLN
jgi:hypothetical protein